MKAFSSASSARPIRPALAAVLGVLASVLLGACDSKVMDGLADTVGGGALPKSQSTIFDDLKRGGEPSEVDRAATAAGEDGRLAYHSDEGPGYFGRGGRSVFGSSEEKLTPSFAPDGTCLHCDGRGFRFAAGRSTRDYIDCTACGGVGRR